MREFAGGGTVEGSVWDEEGSNEFLISSSDFYFSSFSSSCILLSVDKESLILFTSSIFSSFGLAFIS